MSAQRVSGLLALLAGAGVSLYCVLEAGRRTPLLLLVMFVGWVLLPFAVLLMAYRAWDRWADTTRAALCWFSILFAGASIAVYRYVLQHPAKKMAFPFLVIPLGSLLLLLLVVPLATRMSRRNPAA